MLQKIRGRSKYFAQRQRKVSTLPNARTNRRSLSQNESYW